MDGTLISPGSSTIWGFLWKDCFLYLRVPSRQAAARSKQITVESAERGKAVCSLPLRGVSTPGLGQGAGPVGYEFSASWTK